MTEPAGRAGRVGGTEMSGDYTLIGPLAYRGKEGCQNVTCTRRFDPETMEPDVERCWGWHCSYCDAPCSSQGHRCDAAEAVLGEARRVIEEQAQ